MSASAQAVWRKMADRARRLATSRRVDDAVWLAAPDTSQAGCVADLIYELLDAHSDTAELATRFADDDAWCAHLDYLRSLQRVGREALARIPAGRCR